MPAASGEKPRLAPLGQAAWGAALALAVRTGMTEEEVAGMLGEPFARLGEGWGRNRERRRDAKQ